MAALRLLVAALLITACAAIGGASAGQRGPLVFAAASLQESMNAAADAWAKSGHPRPVLSFAGSSVLARQIAAGGPADLFVSADEKWMDELQRRGLLVPGTRATFLGNHLVLVAPAASHGTIAIRPGFNLAGILHGRHLAMADPAGVPAGIYGKQALQRLGVWQSVAANVARAQNVRAALALVERGATPLGIVYATDARASKAVRVVGVFPDASHDPIRYPVARLRSSKNPGAEAFRRFLLSPQGRAIFRRFGFVTG